MRIGSTFTYSDFQMRETSRLLKLKLELSTPGIKR
jgi:hypothetical protein